MLGVGQRVETSEEEGLHARTSMNPARAGNQSLTTVPFLSLHSFSLTVIQPLALQLFWPEQELVAVLHALWPLHELMPEHLTFASLLALATAGKAAALIPAEAQGER